MSLLGRNRLNSPSRRSTRAKAACAASAAYRASAPATWTSNTVFMASCEKRRSGPDARSPASPIPPSTSTVSLRSERPARLVGRVDELIGLGLVGDLHVRGVPHQPLTGEAQRDVAEQHALRERTGVVEVRHGLALVADRVEPVLLVTAVASFRHAR